MNAGEPITNEVVQRIAEIKIRVGAATPGPWTTTGIGKTHGIVYHIRGGSERLCIAAEMGGPDSNFIAAARRDVPWLLERLEEARRDQPGWVERILQENRRLTERVKELSLMWEKEATIGG